MRNLTDLSDDELILSLKSLVGDERGGLVSILKHLSEFEKRQIATETGFPSLFDYCVRELRYAQNEALRRIKAARATSKYRMLYRLLERGTLSLTTVAMLEPHLKWDNYRRLIRASVGLSTREVEALLAALSPIPVAPVERIRFLSVAPPAPAAEVEDLFSPPIVPPVPGPVDAPAFSGTPASDVAPAAPATGAVPPEPAVRRVHFSFTADEALWRDVERAKELARHRWPGGALEDVFAGAVKALLDKIDPDKRIRRKDRRRRLAAGARSRNIPQTVKDAVWSRDGGRCVFPAAGDRLCGARSNLEFDHVRPWALGGGSGDAANIRLLCRAHNQSEARRVFGRARIDAAIARGS